MPNFLLFLAKSDWLAVVTSFSLTMFNPSTTTPSDKTCTVESYNLAPEPMIFTGWPMVIDFLLKLPTNTRFEFANAFFNSPSLLKKVLKFFSVTT